VYGRLLVCSLGVYVPSLFGPIRPLCRYNTSSLHGSGDGPIRHVTQIRATPF
jgi:hypothetical protein